MKDKTVLMLLLILVAVVFVIVAVTGSGIVWSEAYANGIKYHEKLSVVEANALCDKIVRGVK